MTGRPEHAPVGDPCEKCGGAPENHRIPHQADGETCSKCGFPAEIHRDRPKRRNYNRPHKERKYYVGIDGEGQGHGPHNYHLIAACGEDNRPDRTWFAEVQNGGLSTTACLDFILSLPNEARIFAYAFNYDLTKILTDLDNKALFRLFRPELRQRPAHSKVRTPYPVLWYARPNEVPYVLNLQGSKFSVKRGNKMRVVWDVFKFYQAKFVNALKEWKVGDMTMLDHMEDMKLKRSEFDKQSRDEIRAYCFDECRSLAKLVRKLVEAHEKVDLELTSFYGAGSTGGALLKKMGVKDHIHEGDPDMKKAIACAFFGGRFEHSVIGPIQGPVYGYDISSAYPYQLTFLPCLMCGTWSLTKNRKLVDTAQAALVRYAYGDPPEKMSWAPFPFREPGGTVVFPKRCGGGWIWKDEYLAGERHFPHVQFKEAWVYRTECDHQPFRDLPTYYRERVRIGKEGPGIVIKLGCNSVYGKLAQSIGVPPYQCWIWAGMTTSGCRAQLLELIAQHKNHGDVLAVATDGLYSRVKLDTPRPRETGTFDCVNEKGEPVDKPLGGWERKVVPQGAFFARPGIYFPLNPTEKEISALRARGIGRKSLFEFWERLVDGWMNGEEYIKLPSLQRFIGAKSSISVSRIKSKVSKTDVIPNPEKPFQDSHNQGVTFSFNRGQVYGEWIERPIELSFNPMPKREEKFRRNKHGVAKLKLRELPERQFSLPYNRSIISPEAAAMRAATQEMLEQPDADLSEYEEESTE